MPIEAVKIPQNVYVEDKIIGPVSLRQLAITGLGTGIGYMFYGIAVKAGVRNIVELALCWIPAVLAAAFAFLKINDLSLLKIILLFIEGLSKPKERYWSPHAGISINLITRQAVKEAETVDTKISSNASKLADITRQMEKRQEAMNHLAAHDNPNPDALEAVKTQIETVDRNAQNESDAVQDQKTTLRVNTKRVKSDGLDPALSIDGIAKDTAAYERLISTQS